MRPTLLAVKRALAKSRAKLGVATHFEAYGSKRADSIIVAAAALLLSVRFIICFWRWLGCHRSCIISSRLLRGPERNGYASCGLWLRLGPSRDSILSNEFGRTTNSIRFRFRATLKYEPNENAIYEPRYTRPDLYVARMHRNRNRNRNRKGAGLTLAQKDPCSALLSRGPK